VVPQNPQQQHLELYVLMLSSSNPANRAAAATAVGYNTAEDM
jgi:hypothetical protein